MPGRTVHLVDRSGKVVATAQVADEGAYYAGAIDLRQAPTDLRALFEEFEEVVNGQMFAFLDDVQERIGAFSLKAVFENGPEARVRDLQVFPSTGEVSFRLAEVATPGAGRV